MSEFIPDGILRNRALEVRLAQAQAEFDAMGRQREAEIVAEIVARNRRLLPCPYKRP